MCDGSATQFVLVHGMCRRMGCWPARHLFDSLLPQKPACVIVKSSLNPQVPEAVAEWVEDMASSWDFKRIIPCHMAAPIEATPDDLR